MQKKSKMFATMVAKVDDEFNKYADLYEKYVLLLDNKKTASKDAMTVTSFRTMIALLIKFSIIDMEQFSTQDDMIDYVNKERMTLFTELIDKTSDIIICQLLIKFCLDNMKD